MKKSGINFLKAVSFLLLLSVSEKALAQKGNVFAKDNLVAWCIVPFDAQQRGPDERAAMLKELGIGKLAYDWREEHLPTFDDEWKALTKNNIGLTAFWLPAGKNAAEDPNVQAVFEFLKRNQVKTQLWLMMHEWEGFETLSQSDKITAMTAEITYIARQAEELGCKVGLYNHGGWFGEPENQLEIIARIASKNVGIVYNFHHARKHQNRFSTFYPRILPYLYCVNIAGLKEGDVHRFYRTGQGGLEKEMIRQIWRSKYSGPIGIINHDESLDARIGLIEEMEGLKRVLYEVGNKRALRTYRATDH